MKGIVERFSRKQFEGKVLTSFALKGQDGWYSLGERAPTFREGDAIQFNVATRGKYNYAQDIVPWTDGGATTAPQVSESSYGQSNSRRSSPPRQGAFRGGKSDEEKAYWAKRDATQELTQKKIEIQAARNAAIETAKFLYGSDLVPKAKGKAEHYDVFLALVDQIATDYLANTEARLSSPDEAPQAEEQVGNEDDGNGGEWD